METITSKENRIFKHIVKLNTKKYRDETGFFIVEGENLVREATYNDLYIQKIVINADNLPSGIGKTLEYLRVCNLLKKVVFFSEELFLKLSDTVNPQGICAVVKQKQYGEEEFFAGCEGKNFVLLDGVQDPGNVGTIVRTAEAAGYTGVISANGSADIYSPKVVRACAGTIFRMPVIKIKNTKRAINLLKKNNKRVICLDMDGSQNYFEADLKKDIALILGNEGNGVSSEALKASNLILKIPMAGEVESLNVAVAASIVMYENMRI